MWRKLLCLLAASCSTAGAAQASQLEPPADARSLEFVENRGQWPAPVRYAADVPGGRLFLEPGGLTYALWKGAPPHDHPGPAPATAPDPAAPMPAHCLRVRFAGGAAQPAIQPGEQTAEVRNYLRGNDPRQWAANVPGFRQLRYQQVWPGVGVRFYENSRQQLEYDFELAAHADPAAVQLRYDGADALSLTAEGSLEIRTTVGVVRELAPQAWQTDAAGRRQPVACAYVLRGQLVSFRLAEYDHSRPLVIDPTVVFSTYTGATADNWGFTAAYDAQGNLYSGGIVFGLGYPVTAGAYSTTFGGTIDIGLIKYNPATTGPAARVWATYLGGSQADFPHSLVVNAQGELVLLGTTGSNNYPTTAGAYDRTFNGGSYLSLFGSATLPNGSDLVVTRLSANGSTLLGSTYLGGTSNDGLLLPDGLAPLVHNYGDQFRGDIQLDAAGNIYIASNTASPDFPVLNGLGGGFRGGVQDAVVCKLSPTAGSLLWSSYLGGSASDAAYSLQLDGAGRLYVAGGTSSPNFPATAGTLHPTYQGSTDGFVARLSQSGTQLERATYLGTAAYDQCYFVQLDGSGAVYALGQSLGSYPVTAGRYQNAGSHQFIHKLDADLTTTGFSTVFGSGRSSIDISPTAFLVDQCNRIYVSGWGGSINQSASSANGNTFGLPVSGNAVQPTTDGNDFYLLQLAPDAARLDYATFFGRLGGNDHVDGGTSRFDPRGIVYQAVCACGGTSGFPIPPGAGTYSPTSGYSNCNNAAFKIDFEPAAVLAGPDRSLCADAGPQALGGTPAGGTWSGPGVSGSVAAGFAFTPTPALLGLNTLTYTLPGAGACGGTATLRLTVLPAATFAALPSELCLASVASAAPVPLLATPAGGTFSGPGVVGSLFYPSQVGAGTYSLSYTATTGSCTSTATTRVTVAVAPTLSAVWQPEECAETRQAPLRVRFSVPLGTVGGLRWDFGDGTQDAGSTVGHTYIQAGTYQPRALLSYGSGCTLEVALPPVEVLPPAPVPNIITPNGDDKNEFFQLTNGCPARLQVFSRWGNKVFETAAYRNDWNGGTLPDGVYYYLLRYDSGPSFKGWVEISRR